MRLCVINDEISQDLATSLTLCRKHRFSAIEIRSVDNTPPHELSLNRCREIREHANSEGVEIAAFASAVFKAELSGSQYDVDRQVGLLENAMERAQVLSCRTIRIFSFFRAGEPNIAKATDLINEVLRKTDTSEFELALETGTRTNCPTAALAESIVVSLDTSNIGLLWDPGNTVFSGFGDASGTYGLDDIGKRSLKHVHVKDPDGTARYVRLGEGSIDWPKILRRLVERNYEGFLSLETHWRPNRELTPQQRDTPWGDEFSRGGLEASDQCMEAMVSWRSMSDAIK